MLKLISSFHLLSSKNCFITCSWLPSVCICVGFWRFRWKSKHCCIILSQVHIFFLCSFHTISANNVRQYTGKNWNQITKKKEREIKERKMLIHVHRARIENWCDITQPWALHAKPVLMIRCYRIHFSLIYLLSYQTAFLRHLFNIATFHLVTTTRSSNAIAGNEQEREKWERADSRHGKVHTWILLFYVRWINYKKKWCNMHEIGCAWEIGKKMETKNCEEKINKKKRRKNWKIFESIEWFSTN